jgi:hypothetical protein
MANPTETRASVKSAAAIETSMESHFSRGHRRGKGCASKLGTGPDYPIPAPSLSRAPKSETRLTAGRPSYAPSLALARRCPKFATCSAGFCPLVGGVHLKGEAVCPYLSEIVKRDGVATISRRLPPQLVKQIELCLPTICGSLATALNRAATTPSRMKSPTRVQAVR